ncbi:hypothetical protein GS399_01485 [Pedobacter sp. HMF7647]|uniref:Uncharacterized protein n=1 Tax=Hufsiella arboris TaxID=2695275 RepID=A0A7K1Y6G4_9SPHI|nr:hypothetical protein [Hufsiella arboris]MXV49628.1 hypothetical protein [Hufsiella arboris]
MSQLIEQRVWDYIDRTLPENEHQAVKALIENDEQYSEIYAQLIELQQSLNVLDLEEPSMRFTANVMEQVKISPAPGSVSSIVNKNIVRGIGLFFILTISALLVMLFANLQWQSDSGFEVPEFKLPAITLFSKINKSVLWGFLFADVILGLYLVDGWLRKRLFHK